MQVNLENMNDSMTTPNCSNLETNDDYHFYFSLFISSLLSVNNYCIIHH